MQNGNEMKPVAWMDKETGMVSRLHQWSNAIPLYTAPRKLSDEVVKELIDCLQEAVDGMGGAYAIWSPKAREILKKASEK